MAVIIKIQNISTNEILEIPFYQGRIRNPSNDKFILNTASFQPNINSGITLYEDAVTPLLSLLDKYTYDELFNNISETYKTINLKSELNVKINWTRISNMSYTGKKGITVSIQFPVNNTNYFAIVSVTKGIETIGNACGYYYYNGSIPFIDSTNKAFGTIYDSGCLIMDINNPPKDYRYILVKPNNYKKKGGYPYTEPYIYLEGTNSFPNTFREEDIGKHIYNKSGVLTDKIAYDYVFNGVKIPNYPDQDPDNEDDDSGQPTPDPPLPGDGDTTSDPIPDPPPLPTVDVTDTGFVVIYNPTVLEIRQLAYFMWSGDFADLIKKVFAEPFAALISLKILYSPISKGASQTVWLGNVETDVSMSKVTAQFSDVDMGTINVNEFFGSFADYAPFTKIQIFLPFIGYKDLNTDEIMNSQLHLRYRVDVYSGACIAFLTITKTIKSTQLNSILYQFDGNCAMEIPFTSNDNSRYVSAILNSAASSALSLANTSTFTQAQPPFMMDKGESAKFTLGSLAPVANGLLDIMSTKPNVQRAGSLAGAVSSMGVKQPYIIIHRPIQHMPANYQHFIGIPLNLSRQLSTVKGYTIISQIFISSQTATDEEITMITEILKSGVIL